MKTAVTAETRPIISGGTVVCRIVWRMMTFTASAAPEMRRNKNDRTKAAWRPNPSSLASGMESPKPMMQIPKTAKDA